MAGAKGVDYGRTQTPDIDALRPRMLGIDGHRFRAVRFFRDTATDKWQRIESWTTTIVDHDTGLRADGRDHIGVGPGCSNTRCRGGWASRLS